MKTQLLLIILVLSIGCIGGDTASMEYNMAPSMSREEIAKDLSDGLMDVYSDYPDASEYEIILTYNSMPAGVLYIPGDLLRSFMSSDATTQELKAGSRLEITWQSNSYDDYDVDEDEDRSQEYTEDNQENEPESNPCTQEYQEYISKYNDLVDASTSGSLSTGPEYSAYANAKEAYDNCDDLCDEKYQEYISKYNDLTDSAITGQLSQGKEYQSYVQAKQTYENCQSS